MSSAKGKDSDKSLNVANMKPFSIKVGRKRTSSTTPGSSRAASVETSSHTTPEEQEPGAKRLQERDLRRRDSSTPESGLQIDTRGAAADESEAESLSDLPPEALKATTKVQFTGHMKHFLWVQYPSATTLELNAIILQKWKELQASRKQGGIGRRRRSEVDTLVGEDSQDMGDEEEGGRRSSRRRAAKNISQSAYTLDTEELDYADSPASSSHSRETGKPTRSKGKKKVGPSGKGKGKKGKSAPKVPPMKIKMIGRSGESDSPIFFAESLESWDEGSGSDRGEPLRDERLLRLKEGEADSETSSTINFAEIGESQLEDDEMDDEEMMEIDSTHSDSEGEHVDYCHLCKDGGELLCCDQCPLTYHMKCLIPPMEIIPDGEWVCPRCEAEPLDGKIEKIYAWRWVTLPRPSAAGGGDDSVMTVGEGGSPTKKTPKGSTTCRFREFFVKWEGKSHWKNSWIDEIRFDVYQPLKLRAYMRPRNMETPPTLDLPPHVQRRHKRRSTASHQDSQVEELEMMLLSAGVRPQWLQIQRVINKRVSGRKGTQYLVKWKELPYTNATWETLDAECGLRGAEEAVQDFVKLRKAMDPKKTEKKEKRKGRKEKNVAGKGPIKKYDEQPAFISSTGGKLHPYQLEGLNWLRFSWFQGTNTILADEMGLGKTIQTISFLQSLFKEGYSIGPFLIAVPLSTIVNWERELELWAPDLYVVTYSGGKENRAVIRENEFSFMEGAVKKSSKMLFKMKKEAPCKFHILLTSYEYISVDSIVLSSINWQVLVVDEAHRLKNNQSKFFRVLNGYGIKYKLLLTGTPLQNNLEELFHLLNFLNSKEFNSLEDFQDEFEDISKEEQVMKLHDLLSPHLLRRLKADVLKNIPPKRELIVRVELSPMQKKYYRWILTRNFEKLNTRGAQPVSLLNIMMDLKKCCNHPYLFPTASHEAALTPTGWYEGNQLTKASGKFVVLEKMLRKLRTQGHRVLIFSQMTRMLDILEDFLEYLGMGFERIDGNITGTERQISIDRFNTPGSKQSVFLLSTRAGGLGINLATADTVVIYDSDWNPHNDIQALSRAHRIGQSNKVMIYRFVTRSSVEERITEVAKRKMMLTHLVVRPGMGQGANAPALSKRELDDILRFGTEELFKHENVDDDISIHYDDKAIEALLDRSVDVVVGEEGAIGSENLLANDYLSSFKVASYVMKETDQEEPEAEILTAEGETSQKPDPDFWEKLLRHHYEQQAEVEAAKLGKGKRVRKQVNYLDASGGVGHDSDQSSYQQSDEEVSEDDSDDDVVEFTAGGAIKKKVKPPKDTTLPPLVAKINDTIYVLGFNPRQRKSFVNAVMRYGMPPSDAYHTKWRSKDLSNIPNNAFEAYTNLFMRHLCEPEDSKNDTYSDGVPKDNLSRQNTLTRIGILRLVKSKIEQYDDINGTHSMPELIPVVSSQPINTPSDPPLPTPDPAVVQPSEDGTEEKMDTSESTTKSPIAESNPCAPVPESNPCAPVPESNPCAPVPESNPCVPVPESDSNAPVPESDSNAPVPVSDSSNKEIKFLLTSKTDNPKTSNESSPFKDDDDSTKENGAASPEDPPKLAVIVDPPEKSSHLPASHTQRFMFNIADGGFTDIHNIWGEEKTKGFSPSVWGRRHDYWLLKGVTTLGYCRWTEICNDVRFVLLNKPFPEAPLDKSMPDFKAKFLLKKFKLLEQALAIEEQLHRASNCGLVQDPNNHVMMLHSRFTDLDCLADGHAPLIGDAVNKNKHTILLMKKALSKMEELLTEMKADVTRLPSELGKLQSVSRQLKIDEISTISKLAKGGSITTTGPATTQSVITKAPAADPTNIIVKKERTDLIFTQNKGTSQSKIVQGGASGQVITTGQLATSGQTIQLPAGSQVVQTPEGLLVYGAASTGSKTAQHSTVIQAVSSSNTSTQQAYTLGVPTAYMDSSSGGIYQAVQLVPVSGSSQQLVYWPTQGAQVSGVPAGSQMAVVQEPQVIQAVKNSVTGATGKLTASGKPGGSIITID